eukprot:COSAG01_NODE_51223_length_356_cov_1.256809_1_plen_48_part_01
MQYSTATTVQNDGAASNLLLEQPLLLLRFFLGLQSSCSFLGLQPFTLF